MPASWLEQVGLSLEEAGLYAGLLGVAVALVTAARPLREAMIKLIRRTLVLAGWYDRKYARWFISQYRYLHNPYLDEKEPLDLGETYVPLTLTSGETMGFEIATELLSRGYESIVIVGEPGSGKSTLLQAYGVGIIRSRGRHKYRELSDVRPTRQIPFFVPLRVLSREDDRTTVKSFIVEKILIEKGICRDAEYYFNRLVRKKRCLILLDGLDEVSTARHEHVRDAVYDVVTAEVASAQGAKPSVVLSCRTQNWDHYGPEWQFLSGRVYKLAQFREADVARYLAKRRKSFIKGKTPEGFLSELVESGTLDIHQTPLILAMSVGLYAMNKEYKIPSSIPALFDSMIAHMLDRQAQAGKIRPLGPVQRFLPSEQRALLRAVALGTAQRSANFDDFYRPAVVEQAMKLAQELPGIRTDRVEEFADHVIVRSGIIREMSDDGTLAFAHRALHEYLAAERLSRAGSTGVDFLVDKANADHWKQTTIFFAGISAQLSIHTTTATELVRRLADKNLALAGHCLSGAIVEEAVSRVVIERLTERLAKGRDVRTLLPSLVACARSPSSVVREQAIESVQALLGSTVSTRDVISSFFGRDTGVVVEFVNSLANGGSPEMAELAAGLASAAPEDHRLVDPLWRCLSLPGFLDGAGGQAVVRRLLTLCFSTRCFDRLQQLSSEIAPRTRRHERDRAYPFKHGVDIESNFVTLLTLADRLGVVAHEPCRYFQAKEAGPRALRALERSHRWSIPIRIVINPSMIGLLSPVAAVMVLIVLGLIDSGLVLDPLARFGLLGLIVPAGVTVLALIVLAAPGRADETSIGCMAWLGIPAASVLYSVVLLPVANQSWIAWAVVASLACFVLIVLPVTQNAPLDILFHVPPLSPYLDAYQDPRCRHWITSPKEPSTRLARERTRQRSIPRQRTEAVAGKPSDRTVDWLSGLGE